MMKELLFILTLIYSMIRWFCIFLILLCSFQVLKAQDRIDKKEIDLKLSLTKNALYVVNGIPYIDSIKLDSALRSYEARHLLALTKINQEKTAGILCLKHAEIAVLYFAIQQDKKIISKRLRLMKRSIFKDSVLFPLVKTENPTIILNGDTVPETKRWKIIKTLKIDKIHSINDRKQPFSSKSYEQKGSGRYLVVFTKD